MERKEQVTQWVRNKIEKVVDEELKLKIVDENSSFDVETYVNYLLDTYFYENEVESLKKSLNISPYYDLFYFESENSSEGQNSIPNSLVLESNEYLTVPVAEIIKNLDNDSEEVKVKFLRVLELSVEDLINQNFLNKIIDILQRNFNKTENEEVLCLVLKVFQKLLNYPKNPALICKVFTSIAEVLANQIDIFNLKVNAFEKIYDIKEEKWVCEIDASGLKFKNSKSSHFVNPEILIKLMKLLLDCQQQIRIKGVRFNETKYREIIFSFIHLLSSTTASSKEAKLSGLELVSVLDPKATWCKHWCHTAVGRTLLCSALRKYKNFFILIIEIMLRLMRTIKTSRLPSVARNTSVSLIENTQKFHTRVKEVVKPNKKTPSIEEAAKKFPSGKRFLNDKKVSSAFSGANVTRSTEFNKIKKKDQEWVIKEIPNKIVNEAVFFHSVSFVSCLIQFRSGRALFPVQTTTKKRLLNVQDMSLSIIEHLQNLEFYANGMAYTSAYQAQVLEILNDLKKLKTHISSSRASTER